MLSIEISLEVARGLEVLAQSRAFKGQRLPAPPMIHVRLDAPWQVARLLRLLGSAGDQLGLSTFAIGLVIEERWAVMRSRARVVAACLDADEDCFGREPRELANGARVLVATERPRGLVCSIEGRFAYSARWLNAWAPPSLPEGERVEFRGALLPGWLALRWPPATVMDPRCWVPVPGFREGAPSAGVLRTWIARSGATLPEGIVEQERVIDASGTQLPILPVPLADRLAKALRSLRLIPVLDPEDETAQAVLELREALLGRVGDPATSS
ncbi:MAG: hypothetical protein H6730_08845 [Deltaproteobacteria bacterium]|nr:hypothetical protein [Deltaproteobacteria bacterium]